MSIRKSEHITLAKQSQTKKIELDNRFFYEPVLSAHPENNTIPEIKFANKKLKYPIWISSITGGTSIAKKINKNLAKSANEFGLGMALGSCRCLLENNDCFDDFNVKKHIGNQPFYANLGIAQIEKIIKNKDYGKVSEIIEKLQADGLFIHINPLQEIFQPEGDKIYKAPIETLNEFIANTKINIFVKEVGQGFGPESLKELLMLDIQGVEFAGFGGTNFSKLEMLRNRSISPLHLVGHTADEMIEFYNNISGKQRISKDIIISGGIDNFLDGYYYINKINANTIYGQAYTMLHYAAKSYTALKNYILQEIKGLETAYAYLKVK